MRSATIAPPSVSSLSMAMQHSSTVIEPRAWSLIKNFPVVGRTEYGASARNSQTTTKEEQLWENSKEK